jgi:hypothetical protein
MLIVDGRLSKHVLVDISDHVLIRRRRRHCLDSCDESISMARERDDVVVLVRTLTERVAQRRNLTDEIVLLHRRVRPHEIQQLILADHTVAMVE